MVKLGLAALSIFLFFVPAPGTAQEKDDSGSFIHELKGGVLVHDIDGLWSGHSREDGVDINVEVLFTPSVKVLGGALRPALGTTINIIGHTSKLYLYARWEYELDVGLYFALGLGGAVHNGEKHAVRNDRKALGSRVLFHIPVEIGFRFDGHNSLSVYFDHMSNAYLAAENEGMDTLGARYGYRF